MNNDNVKAVDDKPENVAAARKSVAEQDAAAAKAANKKQDKEPAQVSQIVANLQGGVMLVSPEGNEAIMPMENVPDDLSKLDLDDPRVKAELIAYRNQIDLDRSNPNLVAQIDRLVYAP